MSRQVVIAAALIVWVTSLTHAQGARTVRDGIYTDAQAARGQAIYQKQCVSCHGAKLEGLQGPPLIADVFVSHWHTQPLSDLAGKIRNTMPQNEPGTLTSEQTADILARDFAADRVLVIMHPRSGDSGVGAQDRFLQWADSLGLVLQPLRTFRDRGGRVLYEVSIIRRVSASSSTY